MEKTIFNKFLKDNGRRLTKERAAILRKTLSCNGHFDPESLYLQIKKTGLKASRASVYRTLNLLCECGIIEKIRKDEHGAIYERIYGHAHHDHMLCTQCGAVIEFYSRELERIQGNVCKKQGFQGASHTLEIRGYCKNCRKQKK
jgi:Fur family ferric uptake transcriptional regulator